MKIGVPETDWQSAYDDLFFDYNLIRSFKMTSSIHPDLISYDLSHDYRLFLERLEKEGITEEWQIAHLDAYMLLHLFKHGAILRMSAESLKSGGYVSIYHTALLGKPVSQKCVRILPKGLNAVIRSLEDPRVALQTFPCIQDISGGIEDVADRHYYIEHLYTGPMVRRAALSGKYRCECTSAYTE